MAENENDFDTSAFIEALQEGDESPDENPYSLDEMEIQVEGGDEDEKDDDVEEKQPSKEKPSKDAIQISKIKELLESGDIKKINKELGLKLKPSKSLDFITLRKKENDFKAREQEFLSKVQEFESAASKEDKEFVSALKTAKSNGDYLKVFELLSDENEDPEMFAQELITLLVSPDTKEMKSLQKQLKQQQLEKEQLKSQYEKEQLTKAEQQLEESNKNAVASIVSSGDEGFRELAKEQFFIDSVYQLAKQNPNIEKDPVNTIKQASVDVFESIMQEFDKYQVQYNKWKSVKLNEGGNGSSKNKSNSNSGRTGQPSNKKNTPGKIISTNKQSGSSGSESHKEWLSRYAEQIAFDNDD